VTTTQNWIRVKIKECRTHEKPGEFLLGGFVDKDDIPLMKLGGEYFSLSFFHILQQEHKSFPPMKSVNTFHEPKKSYCGSSNIFLTNRSACFIKPYDVAPFHEEGWEGVSIIQYSQVGYKCIQKINQSIKNVLFKNCASSYLFYKKLVP